jgi:RimJ/RimL family protein N-acetyltransferase
VRFAIEYEGQLIGGAGFYRKPSGVAELGFWLGKQWWGLGFATEASRAVVAYGFKNGRVPGFSSAHFIDNLASARVLNKLGFEPTARGRIACVARGYDVEAITYWLSRERALLTVPPLASPPPTPFWRAWLGRLGASER